MGVCLPLYGVLVDADCLAIALCSRLTKEYLINYARPLIFTTALGLPTLVLIRTAYELMASGATQPVRVHTSYSTIPPSPYQFSNVQSSSNPASNT